MGRPSSTRTLRTKYRVENSLDFSKAKEIKAVSNSEEQDNFATNNDYESNSGKDESCSEKALRNPVILRETFKYFSTSFLLSTCSFVNKTWCRDARIFVRNNRKCTARNPDQGASPGYWPSTCRRVQDLSYLCCQMRQQGHEVPFNSFEVELLKPMDRKGRPRDSGCDAVTHISLPSEVSLKYVHITCSSISGGRPIQDSSVKFIRNHASEIKHLKTHSLVLLEGLVGGDEPPTFPELEEFIFSEWTSYDTTVPKNILRSIRARSPKLRIIIVGGTRSLKIFPEELHELLGNLDIVFENFFAEECLFREIVGRSPNLRELTIDESYKHEPDVRETLSNFLLQLIKLCQDSLEEFDLQFDGLHVLPLLSTNPLKNLTNFSVSAREEDSSDQLWYVLASIDSAKMMPKLKEMELGLSYTGRIREWPPDNRGRFRQCEYTGVRKLTLNLLRVTVNMQEIKAVFPHIASLELILHESEDLPCQEFWELWPDLQELEVRGIECTLSRNFDAEFCGVHKEEAKVLREMDQEYLRAVHIVPIRPSLLTMRKLRTASFDFKLCSAADECSSGDPLAVISEVTELIVLERMSHRKASVSWFLLSSNIDDETESGDDIVDDDKGEDAGHSFDDDDDDEEEEEDGDDYDCKEDDCDDYSYEDDDDGDEDEEKDGDNDDIKGDDVDNNDEDHGDDDDDNEETDDDDGDE